MNREELANLIFPDAKDISYYEEKYPVRNLPDGAVVTRFAPSPTGFVHIGALEQCIVETALVKQTKGVMILRIEDTDQKRKIDNGIEGIVSSLRDFDIQFDEGALSETSEKGLYGPYIQSHRRDIYQSFAKYLLIHDRAYPCFASAQDLEEMRRRQEAEKLDTIGYYGKWAKYRDYPVDKAAERIRNGDPYVIRFKSIGKEGQTITHNDAVKGKVTLPVNIMDIVLIKGDGLPTYHFAHLVDDHLMRTTHVIRSAEWFPSVALHLELFHAFGFKAPKYCHYAPMLKEDVRRDENGDIVTDENGEPVRFKRKISKRKDPEAAVSYYYEAGIPKESVKEYLMTVANSDFEMWRQQNPDKDLYEFPFKLRKMSTTEGALFDMDKLINVSKGVIATFDAQKVYDDVYTWAGRFNPVLKSMLEDRDYSVAVLGIERDTHAKKKRKDIGKWSDVQDYISYMYDDQFYSGQVRYDWQTISDPGTLTRILSLYLDKYYDPSDDNAEWFNKLKDLSEETGYAREVKLWRKNKELYPGHVGDVSTAIRIAVTGRAQTPDLCQIMQVMGEKRVRERISYAIKQLENCPASTRCSK